MIISLVLIDARNTLFLWSWIDLILKTLLDSVETEKLVVTNANPREQIEYGINHSPYPVFTMNHNPNKTDPSYFNILMSNYHLQATDIIYIEHNIKAVESASSLGISSYHFDKDLRDIDKLKKRIQQQLYQ